MWLVAAAVLLMVAGLIGITRGRSDRPRMSTDQATCDSPSGPGGLVAFDPATGQSRWQRVIGDATGPAAIDGVFVAVGQDGIAVGVDVDSGDLRWCRRVDDVGGTVPVQGSLVVAAAPVVAMATAQGDVVGLDPVSGEERWRDVLSLPETAVLSVANGVLYVQVGIANSPDGNATQPGPAATSVLAALAPASGAAVPDPPPPPGRSDTGASTTRLTFTPTHDLGRQELVVTVNDPATGAVRWSNTLPGFTAALHDDLVVVIDQSGGTGTLAGEATNVDTRVTAYSASDGTRRWQLPMPGSPQMTFEAAGLVLVADHTHVYAIDPASGAVKWDADHGSPGQDSTYAEPGSYWTFSESTTDQVLVGLIVASKPEHD